MYGRDADCGMVDRASLHFGTRANTVFRSEQVDTLYRKSTMTRSNVFRKRLLKSNAAHEHELHEQLVYRQTGAGPSRWPDSDVKVEIADEI